MLKLPGKDTLDNQIREMLQGKYKAIIEVPTEDEKMVAFESDSLQSLNDVTLILGIEQERTDAGRGMIRGLWHDKVVLIWLYNETKKLRIVASPYKCHVVGPVFLKVYNLEKRINREAEVSVVWELMAEECKVTDEPLPEPVVQKQDGEYEYHLDHPFLLKRQQ